MFLLGSINIFFLKNVGGIRVIVQWVEPLPCTPLIQV